ncbi:C-4 methylsterol oxidase [Aureococcus anophagefferens]|nr:C-4 methylsterol oxidase [Aureococcus anophagefferens]
MARLGGIHEEGLFGGVPAFVDRALAPGYSDQTKALSLKSTARDIATLRHFFLSPNLVWFAMALAMHLGCPYDVDDAAAGWARGWVLKRLALNFSVAFAYYGYWHFMLYRTKDQGGASRKYEPDSWPTAGNMAHNLWYWSLGVAQWTFWECAMCRIWGTGGADFATDAAVFGDYTLLLKNAAVLLLVPVWRDFHFYVAHRFLHVRACYKYVHGLHHRNADPEPFSGMCMHPVEHLYYFSNAFFPTLLVDGLSPLVFLWALCVSKVAMRDFAPRARPRFRLSGSALDDAPMAPMVGARHRVRARPRWSAVERFEELRALERNHVAFHLATLTPTPRALVAKRQEALAWSYDVGLAHFWPPSQEFARAEIYASFPQAGPAFAPSLPRYYDNMRAAARPPSSSSATSVAPKRRAKIFASSKSTPPAKET